jgi:hypothetical protein
LSQQVREVAKGDSDPHRCHERECGTDPKTAQVDWIHLTGRLACANGRNIPSMGAFRSPFADVVIAEVAVTEYVMRRAAEVPDRVALIDGPSGRTYTYAQLHDMIHRWR